MVVDVVNGEVTPEDVEGRTVVLDILVRLADGRAINVEMQSAKQAHFRDRSLYYWARAYGMQLEAGSSFGELRPVVSVLFLAHRELEGDRLHSVFHLLEIHDHQRYSEALEVHVVELPKRPRGPDDAPEEAPELLDWAQFLGARTDEEARSAAMKNQEVAQAYEDLKEISGSPEARELARRRQLALDGYRIEMGAALAKGRREGLEEGRKEGLEEGWKEGRKEGLEEGLAIMLLELLAAKFGPVDAEVEARVRSASEDLARTWGRRIITAGSLDEVFGSG